MKKNLTIIGIFLCSIFSAQMAPKYGIKAGVTLANVDSEIDYSTIPGYYGGFFANLSLGGKLSLQPEILYSAKGCKRKTSSSNVRYNFDYIDIPIMLQYNFTDRFYAELGPQFGFLIMAKSSGDNPIRNIKSDLYTFDFDAALGVGFHITPKHGVNARYVRGFTNISKEAASGEGAVNSIFQLGLGYRF